MSSLRNAHKTQRIHKERHQPTSRDHLGPLEKKKDYIKRAKNQNIKKNKIKKLHKKALNKNPDEFHFHMIKSSLKDGVHVEKVLDEELSVSDVVSDLTYIIHRRSMEKKKIERLQSQLHLLGVGLDSTASSSSFRRKSSTKNKHIFFVDTEKEARTADPAKILDTHPSLLNRPFNRLKTSQLAELSLELPSKKKGGIKKVMKERKKAYYELAQRIAREEKLKILQEKLQVRKKLLERKNKNEPLPELVKEGTKTSAPIYKWPQERKK